MQLTNPILPCHLDRSGGICSSVRVLTNLLRASRTDGILSHPSFCAAAGWHLSKSGNK